MKGIEFGVGYMRNNSNPQKPIHTAYSDLKVKMGMDSANRLAQSDSPEMRRFASYWINNIGFFMNKTRNLKIATGKWTIGDEETYSQQIQALHNIKRDEVERGLSEPMSEKEMADFVIGQYQEKYPRDKEINMLAAAVNDEEDEDWFGVHEFFLNF